MTRFFEGYKTTEYLHYWMADAPSLHLDFERTKGEIMQRHLNTMTTRIASEAQKASSAGIDPTVAELFLSGDLFPRIMSDGIKSAANAEKLNYANGFDELGATALALVKAGVDGMGDLDEFISLLQDWFNELDSNKQQIANEYSDWLFENITSSRLGKNVHTMMYGKGQEAQKIIASILANTHDSVFTKGANGNGFGKLSTTEKKMVAVLNYAKIAAQGDFTYTVNHHDARSSETVTSTEQLTAALAAKVQGGIEAQHRMAFEISNGLCYLQAATKGLTAINDVAKFNPSGTKQVEIDFRPDALQKQALENIKVNKNTALKYIAGKKVSKADSTLSVTLGDEDGTVVSTWGLSTKSSNWSWKSNIDTVDIKVQDGTPLLTLLMREAGFSGRQMYDIYQLAGGTAGIHTGTIDTQWNELINIAKYEAVLDCIAGMPTVNSANGQVFLVNINDTFFTVSDLLQNIMAGGDVSLLYSSANADYATGLDRQTYVYLNYFVPQVGKNRIAAAWERSERSLAEIPELMYRTKIRVNLNLKNMIAFSKMNGFLRS